MFDSRKIGKKIADFRKAKDLTQLELADKLQVSYQAVSNWERGNSMPDISNLVELSKILAVSIEEILDSDKESRIVKKMIDNPEEVNLREAAEVAVLIKPAQLEGIIENNTGSLLESVTLVSLAPYVSAERLMEMVGQVNFTDLDSISSLAPFLESKDLVSIILKQKNLAGDLSGLSRLAPFLKSQDLITIIRQNPELLKDPGQISGLAPFLDQDDLEEIVDSLPEGVRISEDIVSLAPFMSGQYVARLGRRAIETGKSTLFQSLLPCMDTSQL